MFRIIILLFIVGILYGCDSQQSSTNAPPVKIVKHPVTDHLPSMLINEKGEQVNVDTLSGKTVGFYFSAHWCPPCKVFTPKLVKFYNEMKAKNENFEIVFVSYGKSEAQMKQYMTKYKMPWLALPFGDKGKSNLIKMFNGDGIPNVGIVDVDGKLITRGGRKDVEKLGNGAFQKWTVN